MASAPSDHSADAMLAAFKIVIAGGFGAGKTTLVGAVSEVQPLHTEETLTSASIGMDDVSGVEGKTTTTVAMDFGRLTISDRLVLYLFGTPGQERFWFMWDELSYGALGAVVLADTRRLDDCFPSVDYFEKCGLPFVIGINCFTDSPEYDPEDVRVALDLGPQTPVMLCDARQPASVKEVLITLVEHVLAISSATSDPAPRPAASVPPVASPPPDSEPLVTQPQPAHVSGPPPQVSGPPPQPAHGSGPPPQPVGPPPPPLVQQEPIGQPPAPLPGQLEPVGQSAQALPVQPEPIGQPAVPQPSPGQSGWPQPGQPEPVGQPMVTHGQADAPIAPPLPPPVGLPSAPHPAGQLPPAWPAPPPAYGPDGAAGPPAVPPAGPHPETPVEPVQADPTGRPEPPPDAAVPADREKTGWRSPLSRWRAAP